MAWMFSDNDRTKADVDHPVSGISRHPVYLHCTQVENTDIESFETYTLYLHIQHLFTGHIWPRKRRHLTDGEGGGGGEVGGAGDHNGGEREAGQPVDGDGHPPPHWQTRKCHRQPPASGCLDRHHNFSTQNSILSKVLHGIQNSQYLTQFWVYSKWLWVTRDVNLIHLSHCKVTLIKSK